MSQPIQTNLERFESMLHTFNPIATITSLSLDCWQMFGEETLGDPLFSQAGLEYVAGVYSKMPENLHSAIRPRADQISAIKEMSSNIGKSLFGLAEWTTTSDADRNQTAVSHAVFTYFCNVRGEGYPHRLMKLFVERYSPHNPFLQSHLGLTAEQIATVFQHLFLLVSANVNYYFVSYKIAANEVPYVHDNLASCMVSPIELSRISDAMRMKDLDG